MKRRERPEAITGADVHRAARRERPEAITGADVHRAVEAVAAPWISDGRARLVIDDESHSDRRLVLKPTGVPDALQLGVILRGWGADLMLRDNAGGVAMWAIEITDTLELAQLEQIVRAALLGQVEVGIGLRCRFVGLSWPEGKFNAPRGFFGRRTPRKYEAY